jgi:Na+/H+-translocating membrane pyrophosphatase
VLKMPIASIEFSSDKVEVRYLAMTMKSVGSAALKMVEGVRRQFNTIPDILEGRAKPDLQLVSKSLLMLH